MTYIYKSGLKSYILGLITQKRADGFAYISEEQLFRQLDNFCMEYFPDARTITYNSSIRDSIVIVNAGFQHFPFIQN